jgi:large conductance mechanosensitive channel
MLKGFRDFILRGNVVDLAVAVVIGTAFGLLVTAFVSSFVTPLIAAIGGKPDFSALAFTINGSKFTYGVFINALIAFLIIAAVIYFFVVQPINTLMERLKPGKPVDAPTRSCPECLSDIPEAARRCSFCTSEVAPVLGT